MPKSLYQSETIKGLVLAYNWPIKSMSKTLIGIGFASYQDSHHLPHVALHFIPLSINTNSMLFLNFFSSCFDLLFLLKQKRQKSHYLSV